MVIKPSNYLFESRIYITITVILLLLSFSCDDNTATGLIILSNEKIEVGILPEIGGRVVLLRKPGLNNILKSDERLWQNPQINKPEISAYSDFMVYGGHITWVGPQSEWWIHQHLNEERFKDKVDWPPDPYLIYGQNEIIKRNNSSITMIGPDSPISGVRLTNEISINDLGIVKIKSTAINIRDENVSWDLWMLTRLDGFAKVYVPIEENGILEFVKDDNEFIETTPYKIIDNYFTFEPSVPVKPGKEQVQEAHLIPSSGFIAGFSEQQLIIIRFEKLDQKYIHSNHGLVELYNYINDKGNDRLLELEIHGAYRTLLPGESMSLTETWELIPYTGNMIIQDQISFLEQIR